VRSEDAMDTVSRLPPESKHLIVSSYFLNCMIQKAGSMSEQAAWINHFVAMAKRALKPGGRLVLVQDKGTVPEYEQFTKRNGMDFFVRPLSEIHAKRAHSWAIRSRATKSRKNKKLMEYYTIGLTTRKLNALIQQGVITSNSDYVTPTLMILRKPRPSKIVKSDLTVLTPEENGIVARILSGEK